MAPLIPSAKATLEYPLYACDFDPSDSSRLVVAGGGGAGKNGVGNKITLLDASKKDELITVGEIELSKDEDNVTSLAVSHQVGNKTHIYAGVNGTSKDVAKGKNQHFRILGVEKLEKGDGKSANKIHEVSRTALFQGRESTIYQRVTRLSRPFPDSTQLGAITTGLVKQSEIVLFDTASTSKPQVRGILQSNKEAVDIDLLQTGDDEYLFAYCDIYDVYVKKISPVTDDEEPQCVYVTPASDAFEKPSVPSFRGLRWLTKDFIVMLTNIHSNGGVVLQILRLPAKGHGHARVVQSHRLPMNISKATGIAVCNLTPPLTPSAPQGYTQFVIAVAGHDISLSLFKVDLQVEAGVYMITKIKPFRTLNKVHPLQMTSLAFSNFTPPAHPVTASTPPQYLKLASTGISNTLVVHTLPLFPVPLSVRKGQSKTPRYVVALPSSAAVRIGILASVIGIALAAIFIQALLEIRGGQPDRLGAKGLLPIRWQEVLGRPYEFPANYKSSLTTPSASVHGYNHHLGVPNEEPTPNSLAEILEKLTAGDGKGIFVVQDRKEGVHATLHDEDTHGPHGGKTWDELPHEEKEGWKKKLIAAGHWAEEMGETILKGVVFGELAGAVGHAVGGG